MNSYKDLLVKLLKINKMEIKNDESSQQSKLKSRIMHYDENLEDYFYDIFYKQHFKNIVNIDKWNLLKKYFIIQKEESIDNKYKLIYKLLIGYTIDG